jgi:putative membrane protein
MDLSSLPAVNAGLNATATVLLVWGRFAIRRGQEDLHRRLMLGAFGVSTVFLASYVLHKASRNFENTTYHAVGLAKTLYLLMLATHVPLAAAVPVLALLLIRFAMTDQRARHRRLARWAWPIWLYVGVTGVLIYLVLYQWNPPAPVG